MRPQRPRHSSAWIFIFIAASFCSPLGLASASAQTTVVSVTIQPPAAVAAGAEWILNGGPPMASGSSVILTTGSTYQISFTNVPGFSTPSPFPDLVNGTAQPYEVTYGPPPTASVTVNIQPPQAAITGAEWNLDGGPAQPSGTTISYLAYGPHTINFIAGNGSTAPPSQAVYLVGQQTTTVTGTFTLTGATAGYQSGLLNVSMDADAVAAGAVSLTLASGSGGVTDPTTYFIGGSFVKTDGTTPFTAWHAAYSARQSVSEAPRYTLLLTGSGSTPQGTGYLTLTLPRIGGGASVTGKLADGAAVTYSGKIFNTPFGHQLFLFDASLYNQLGFLGGAIAFPPRASELRASVYLLLLLNLNMNPGNPAPISS